jgi:hypothetical protein
MVAIAVYSPGTVPTIALLESRSTFIAVRALSAVGSDDANRTLEKSRYVSPVSVAMAVGMVGAKRNCVPDTSSRLAAHIQATISSRDGNKGEAIHRTHAP